MKKSLSKNLVTGFFSQIIIMAMGLIVPRIILLNYGSDSNGLIGTISQIFTYVAILQVGISISAKNALYRPIEEDNKDEISYWMSVAKRYYRKITIVYFILVIFLSGLLPVVLKTSLSYWTVFLYTLFEGLSGCVSFYFVNTWSCFLDVIGKNYINKSLAFIYKMMCYIIKIVLSIAGVNIAFVQVGYFIGTVLQVILYYRYMKTRYAWIDYKMAPKTAKLPDRNHYILSELSWVIFSSTDMIVISAFLSTSISSVYSVYSMVYLSLNGLLSAVYDSIQFNLGLTYVADKEKYKILHDIYNSIFLMSTTVMMSVSYILIIPFIELYTSGVTDIEYVHRWLPLMFCLIQLMSWGRYVSGNLTGIAGYAKQVSYISIIEALFNVVGSIVFVNLWGIEGVLLASVIALPVKVVYTNCLSDRKILKRSGRKTAQIFFVNYLTFGITVLLSEINIFTVEVNTILSFLLWGIVLIIFFLIVLLPMNIIVNKDIWTLLRKYICSRIF